MSEFKISAEPRSVIGKQVKQLRRADIVPGNIYAKGVASKNIQFNGMELRSLLRRGGKTEIIELTINDASHNVVIKELQRHPTKDHLIHLDLQIVE